MTLALDPEENDGRQSVTVTATKTETDTRNLDKLDAEILAALRSAARTRKNHFLKTGSALRIGMQESQIAKRLSRQRGVGWKSRNNFVYESVRGALGRLEAIGLIQSEPRITPAGAEIPGFIVPMVAARLTAWDRRFLAGLLIAWDAPTERATSAAGGRGASSGNRLAVCADAAE